MKNIIALILINFLASGLSFASGELPLIGKGVYSFLFMDVYHATLWGNNKHKLYDEDLVLELHYKMKFSGKDIVDQTKKEFQNAGISSTEASQWSAVLNPIIPNVSKNDRIKAKYSPNKGITFYLNDSKKLGKVSDPEISRAFLNIWLGDASSDPDLRDKLRGRNVK